MFLQKMILKLLYFFSQTDFQYLQLGQHSQSTIRGIGYCRNVVWFQAQRRQAGCNVRI